MENAVNAHLRACDDPKLVDQVGDYVRLHDEAMANRLEQILESREPMHAP